MIFSKHTHTQITFENGKRRRRRREEKPKKKCSQIIREGKKTFPYKTNKTKPIKQIEEKKKKKKEKQTANRVRYLIILR